MLTTCHVTSLTVLPGLVWYWYRATATVVLVWLFPVSVVLPRYVRGTRTLYRYLWPGTNIDIPIQFQVIFVL